MFNHVARFIRENKFVVLLFLLAIVSRLPFLSHAFMLRGERDIVLTGLSLLSTGKDLYGHILPVQFFGLDQPSPMLSFYFSALGWLIFPFKSIFFARLPFVISAAVNTILVYQLVLFITKRKNLALITSAIFIFSPGYFHLSTLALEINLAMPLLLAGILAYLKKHKVWGWAFFALSFFTYNGFRPLIPFVLIYLEYYEYLHGAPLKRFVKNSIIAGALFIVFFTITFYFVDGGIMTSRSSDIVFISYDKISPEVIFRRNTSLAPFAVQKIFDNKFTETLHYMVSVAFEGVSLQYLFFRGDRAAIYTSTFAGQFWVVGLVFYFMGFMFMGKYFEKKYLYMLGFIPVALVPSIVNIDYVSVAIRSLLASVSFAYIMALGVLFARESIKKGLLQKAFWLGACAILTIELAYFGYNYVFRRPVTMFESYFEHERQLVEHVHRSPEKLIVYDDSPKNLLTAYHILTPGVKIFELQKAMQGNQKLINTPEFTFKKCPKSADKHTMYKHGTLIGSSCLDPAEYDSLGYLTIQNRIQFEDFSTRTAYFIYEDPLKAEPAKED